MDRDRGHDIGIEGHRHAVRNAPQLRDVLDLAGNDADPEPVAADRGDHSLQLGTVLIEAIQRVPTTTDRDEGLRAMPDERGNGFRALTSMGQKR